MNDLQFARRYQCLPIRCSEHLISLKNEHTICIGNVQYKTYIYAFTLASIAICVIYLLNITNFIFFASSANDNFFFDGETKDWNKEQGCSPRHNIASGSATGLEVFLEKTPEWDSLGEGQLDPNGARVNTFTSTFRFYVTDHCKHFLSVKEISRLESLTTCFEYDGV
jgi:hypothetical protein